MLNLGRALGVISTVIYIQFCVPKDVTRYCHNTGASRNFLGTILGTTLQHNVGNHAHVPQGRMGGARFASKLQAWSAFKYCKLPSLSCHHFSHSMRVQTLFLPNPSEKRSGHPMLRLSILHNNIGFVGTQQSGKA